MIVKQMAGGIFYFSNIELSNYVYQEWFIIGFPYNCDCSVHHEVATSMCTVIHVYELFLIRVKDQNICHA